MGKELMKNIRDIREEKNLYFLLPEDVLVGGFLVCENVNAAVDRKSVV